MRIALISPYSWTYPGGVNRHVGALAKQLTARGHEPVIFAPYDPDDDHARRTHHGVRPAHEPPPEPFVSLGRTVAIPANGSMSNLALTHRATATARRALRQGGFDLAHLHEPVAPAVCWDLLSSATVPLVGTFHTYSTNDITNGVAAWPLGGRARMRSLAERIAVSEAAAWTARRYFGGTYRIIPNGVDLYPAAVKTPTSVGQPLSLVFVGQPVARKGLHVLVEAFTQLRDRLAAPVTLTLVGPTDGELQGMIDDARGIVALGQVSDAVKRAVLHGADILCAPSLFGESFGMVLTEALAAGTPVIASDIPGYRDVVRDGVEGVLVAPGEPDVLCCALAELIQDPSRLAGMAAAGRKRAADFAWPRVAAQIELAYEAAISAARRPSSPRPLASFEKGQHRQHAAMIVARLR